MRHWIRIISEFNVQPLQRVNLFHTVEVEVSHNSYKMQFYFLVQEIHLSLVVPEEEWIQMAKYEHQRPFEDFTLYKVST